MMHFFKFTISFTVLPPVNAKFVRAVVRNFHTIEASRVLRKRSKTSKSLFFFFSPCRLGTIDFSNDFKDSPPFYVVKISHNSAYEYYVDWNITDDFIYAHLLTLNADPITT